MTNTDHRAAAHHQTPTAIRDETFQRRMFGLDADQVYAYLDELADQVQATERELAATRQERDGLRAQVERVRGELAEYEQMGERVNDQIVAMFSQAQLVAEEMVEDVTRDARERIGQARDHERQIVEEAMSTASDQVRTYAREARAQMRTVMDSFASEVDRLGSPSVTREPRPPAADDPLFGDRGDWQVRLLRDGGRPDTPDPAS